jgi:hypothetical protein
MIYYLCPDGLEPTGGIKVIYRHVDLLNEHGREAVVVHESEGHRCTWFPNDTPVTSRQSWEPQADDVVVIPEVYGPNAARIARGVRKVIFNQSGYLTFEGYPPDARGDETPYLDPEVVAALAISDNVAGYLRFVFPEMPVHRVRWSIDSTRFKPLPKRPRICYMPRRHPEDATQVFNILRFRDALDGLEILPLEGMTEDQVAEAMGASILFFSYGYPEGCPLPPAEAMACGCVVVGYHGFGGREYFDPEVCFPVEAGDVIAFAAAAERALGLWAADNEGFRSMGEKARAHIAQAFDPGHEARALLDAWSAIIG